MRHIRSLLAILLVACAANDEGPFRALRFDAALDAATKEHKVVMVDFFTTWCGPCKQLDSTTWRDERVRAWLRDNTVPLKIDAEKEDNLATRMRVTAYPTILFVWQDGSQLNRLVGYREPDQFLKEAAAAIASR